LLPVPGGFNQGISLRFVDMNQKGNNSRQGRQQKDGLPEHPF
jgi:hypothetical protein